jgi:hypothetical protein
MVGPAMEVLTSLGFSCVEYIEELATLVEFVARLIFAVADLVAVTAQDRGNVIARGGQEMVVDIGDSVFPIDDQDVFPDCIEERSQIDLALAHVDFCGFLFHACFLLG